jgi:hypothetical protein
MLRNCDPTSRTAVCSRPAAIALATICGALRDGLAALRRYEHLETWGVSRDRALREALGVGIPAGEVHVAAQYPSCPLTDRPRMNETACARRVPACVHPASHLPASARVGNLAYLK